MYMDTDSLIMLFDLGSDSRDLRREVLVDCDIFDTKGGIIKQNSIKDDQIGLLKCETGEAIIKRAFFLQSKCYSIEADKVTTKCKGAEYNIVKKYNVDTLKEVYDKDSTVRESVWRIQSKNHTLYTIEMANKLILQKKDDKKESLEDYKTRPLK